MKNLILIALLLTVLTSCSEERKRVLLNNGQIVKVTDPLNYSEISDSVVVKMILYRGSVNSSIFSTDYKPEDYSYKRFDRFIEDSSSVFVGYRKGVFLNTKYFKKKKNN